MDTSKEYIRMCREAEEIREEHKEEIGDYLAGSTSLWIRIGYDERDRCFEYIKLLGFNEQKFRKKIWLPRQDQLQAMLEKNLRLLIHDFEHFTRCASEQNDGKYIKINLSAFTTMEQLWLAFVMKEKYNKIWEGNQWTHRK